MIAHIVMVEQQAMGSLVWAALTPLLRDLGQSLTDIPSGVDCLPVLKQHGGLTWPGLENKHATICNTLRSLEFHRWGLTMKVS